MLFYFHHLMRQAYIVVTDSGGIQEEAPTLGKPVLVLRQVTERPEAVEAGAAKVIGVERQVIVNEISRLLDDSSERERMARAVNPYGDGHASGRIVSAILGEPYLPFENNVEIPLSENSEPEQVVCNSIV
jgi:UDP-N-acetylglucosamine 2-epimerase